MDHQDKSTVCKGKSVDDCLKPMCNYVNTDERSYCRTSKNKTVKKKKIRLKIKRPIIPDDDIFKNEESIKACREKTELREEYRNKLNQHKTKVKECEDELYSYINTYFNNNNTVKSLLKALYEFYRAQKLKDIEYKLTFREFVFMFPRDTVLKGHNFKRQHIFEALCKVMLVLNYDHNKWGNKKQFYRSLEQYTSNTSVTDRQSIFEEEINEGSSAQSVDIFFKIPKNKIPKVVYDYPCETPFNTRQIDSGTEDAKKDLYILIQNKLYTTEYSSADKYDVTKIANRAKKFSDPMFDNADFKIVLMVNNKQQLDEKIQRNRNDDFNLVDEIIGLEEMENWFQDMVYDMYKSDTLDIFLKVEREKDKPHLQLRFHQELITRTTYRYNIEATSKESRKKFIWGAVPRSGKSYMIAGLIDKMNQHKINNNDVLIILGAKSETEDQFVDMFSKFDNFNDYGIITAAKKRSTIVKNKNIYIFSQEKMKMGSSLREGYPELFKKKQIDLYFDEIHKGGSTEISQEKILGKLTQYGFTIDIFVMVTATYARPTIAYTHQIENKSPVVLNWSYIDQLKMKQITNPNKLLEFKHTRTTDIERNVINELFDDYKLRYGSEYLYILEEFYKKYPELVIIQPYVDIDKEPFNLHGNVFRLKCSAISETIQDLTDPTTIFNDNQSVVNLIDFIGKEIVSRGDIHGVLSEDCIYGKMKYKYGYDVINTKHSELWFLPDSFLYDNPDQCRELLPTRIKGNEISQNEDSKKDTLPNIEPLTRGLVLNLLNNDFFKRHYNFIIVHNQKLNYYGTDYTKRVFSEKQVKYSVNSRGSVNNIIKTFEEETFLQDKSLIILTGSMLRLGISLPCVDLAFNFDNYKSIDLNYQTMFRVLTERTNKKYGYYFDFFPERAISFLYEYNELYGNGFKESSNMDDLTTHLQSLLYTFNYNGLSISKMDEKETLSLYTSLINKLELTVDAYSEKYIGDNKNTIAKILHSIGDIKDLSELNAYKFGVDKKAVRIVIKKGIGKKSEKTRPDSDYGDADDTGNADDSSSDDDMSIEEIADFLTTYTSLLALFSDERSINCKSLEDCIDKSVEQIENLQEFCNCKQGLFNPLGCYMKRIKGYTQDKFILSLKAFKSAIFPLESHATLRNAADPLRNGLIIIFDTIREHMGRKSRLLYNDNIDYPNSIEGMDINDIEKLIKLYLPVREEEKKKYGEVFTPLSLINNMLDNLPTDVWSNPQLKWLDPANGTGNFPMVVFDRLNKGLKTVRGYSDEIKRKQHIIKNMLYMVELNEKNIAVTRKIFGPEANIYCGSFLDEEWKTHFGIDQFDVIMGNPPFQKEIKHKINKAAGRTTLWDIFVVKAMGLLSNGGFLTFLHPPSWRGLGRHHTIWDMLNKKQLLFLRIYGKKDGNTYFNVGSRFDTYVLQNKENTQPTTIIDEMGNEHSMRLKNMPFLPNYAYKEINKILTLETNGIDVIHDNKYTTQNDMSATKTTTYKYPVVHSINKDGLGFWYTNDTTKGHFGVSKVILNLNEKQYSYPEQNDYNGHYGMSQLSFGIPISSKKEGDLILKAISHPDFKKIIAATKWGAFQTDWRMFKYFKPDFYTYFLDDPKKNKKRKNKTRKNKNLPKSLPSSPFTKTRRKKKNHNTV